MKPTLNQPAKRVGNGNNGSPSPKPDKQSVWKVLIFFVPLPSSVGLPKPPGNKGWLEVVLMLLKVIAALAALVKAIGWAT